MHASFARAAAASVTGLRAGRGDRRSLLLAAASLGLTFALPALPARAARRRGVERPRSLLVVWLAGGPSQLETFDPHPGAPAG